jgi:hypothetical protein
MVEISIRARALAVRPHGSLGLPVATSVYPTESIDGLTRSVTCFHCSWSKMSLAILLRLHYNYQTPHSLKQSDGPTIELSTLVYGPRLPVQAPTVTVINCVFVGLVALASFSFLLAFFSFARRQEVGATKPCVLCSFAPL